MSTEGLSWGAILFILIMAYGIWATIADRKGRGW